MHRHPISAARFTSLEPLEARIAPAAVLPTISADGRKATWTDVDGDKVTLAITKGQLDVSLIDLESGPTQGAVLQELDLSAAQFKGSAVTISALRDPLVGGDNSVNVGFIDAHNNVLGAVKIAGDLAKIQAGLDVPTAKLKALASLTVFSMGAQGADTLDPTENGLLNSEVSGPVGAVTVRGSVDGILFNVTGGSFAGIQKLSIGGSLIGGDTAESGRIATAGGIGAVTVKGSILGGGGQQSGAIEAGGLIGKVAITGSIFGGKSDVPANERSGIVHSDTGITGVVLGGSLIGGTQQSSGVISTSGNIGTVAILGSVRGGDAGTTSGAIVVGGNAGAIKITGDLLGGAAEHSGYVSIAGNAASISILGGLKGGAAFESGHITVGTNATNTLTTLSILGDLKGSSGESSGAVTTTGAVKTATVRGSLLGGTGDGSGVLRSAGAVTTLNIIGSVIGGDLTANATDALTESAYIEAARIQTLNIGGSIMTGTDYNPTAGLDLSDNATIRVLNDIGTLTVKGSILGNADAIALITARGQAVVVQNSTVDVAFGKVTVGGSVRFANVLAGFDTNDDLAAASVNPNAQIGGVAVIGDWVASNLVAGAAFRTDFADGNDTLSAGGVDNPNIIATISNIQIGGMISGTATPTNDHFGFVAQKIGVFTMGAAKVSLPLNEFAGDDNDPLALKYALGSTGDTRLFELPV